MIESSGPGLVPHLLERITTHKGRESDSIAILAYEEGSPAMPTKTNLTHKPSAPPAESNDGMMIKKTFGYPEYNTRPEVTISPIAHQKCEKARMKSQEHFNGAFVTINYIIILGFSFHLSRLLRNSFLGCSAIRH